MAHCRLYMYSKVLDTIVVMVRNLQPISNQNDMTAFVHSLLRQSQTKRNACERKFENFCAEIVKLSVVRQECSRFEIVAIPEIKTSTPYSAVVSESLGSRKTEIINFRKLQLQSSAGIHKFISISNSTWWQLCAIWSHAQSPQVHIKIVCRNILRRQLANCFVQCTALNDFMNKLLRVRI